MSLSDLHTIEVARTCGRWSIKHNGGILGFAADEQEAVRLGRSLASWLDENGRFYELLIERTWAERA